MRDGSACSTAPLKCTLNVTAATSPAWCPNGWVPAPTRTRPTVPIPPPDAGCVGIEKGIPCLFRNDSAYLVGGTWLFDVEAGVLRSCSNQRRHLFENPLRRAGKTSLTRLHCTYRTDPFEEHDLATQNPSIVATMLEALQVYNRTHCNGQPCLPDQVTSKRARGSPTTVDGNKVWLPWDGDPTPSVCDTNRSRGGSPGKPTSHGEIGSFDQIKGLGSTTCHAYGWTAGPGFSGPSLFVQLVIDGKPHGKLVLASVRRAKAGDHGFDIPFPCSLISAGRHVVEVQAHKNQTGPVTWEEQVTPPLISTSKVRWMSAAKEWSGAACESRCAWRQGRSNHVWIRQDCERSGTQKRRSCGSSSRGA